MSGGTPGPQRSEAPAPAAGAAAAAGRRWPAEWEPHAATWLAWPHNAETWPGERLACVQDTFVAIVRALQPRERVELLVADAAMEASARQRLAAGGVEVERGVRFQRIPTDDAWLRDTGPIFVVHEPGGSGRVAAGARARVPTAVDFRFDAWGGKYPPFDRDARVGERIARARGVPREACDLVLEGGSLDGNGRGSVIVTESCLLHPNRGAGRTREGLERILADTLGTRNVLWLANGIEGDDTDGHVDDLARFVGAATVVTAVETDPSDPNHAPLAENLRRLRSLRDERGRPLDVVVLPMPPRLEAGGARLPATHANFYLANGVALVPTFGGNSDARALAILRELLPGRDVVGIRCNDLVYGMGAIHCVTQQEPAVARDASAG